MYGAQTKDLMKKYNIPFENDVEMYGAQTEHGDTGAEGRLRMM